MLIFGFCVGHNHICFAMSDGRGLRKILVNTRYDALCLIDSATTIVDPIAHFQVATLGYALRNNHTHISLELLVNASRYKLEGEDGQSAELGTTNADGKILNRRVTLYGVFILVLRITIATCHRNRTGSLHLRAYGTHLGWNASIPEKDPLPIIRPRGVIQTIDTLRVFHNSVV